VAAVEFLLVFSALLFPLTVGLLEVGRLVQVQQVVSNAAREGARMAAQGFTVNSSGDPTQIKVGTGTPNVRDVVFQYLRASGLTGLELSDIEVTFAFTTARTTDYVPTAADPPGTSYPAGSYPPDPCYGEKNQLFTVRVRVTNWSKVRWTSLGVINPSEVSFTVTWRMLIDDPFTVNETLPTL
jgi:Flp pilus assembly protein TadG